MMRLKLAAGAITAGFALAAMAAPAAAHPLTPPGNEKTIAIGGPLGTSQPGNGAQGHWRGIDCHAAVNAAPIKVLGICAK